MAAALAKGTTRLRNAAAEPHVQDLCHMLVGMGCQISGIGTGTLEIQGAERLRGGRFRISADHIEVGSFIGLAAVTRGEITIEDAGAGVPRLDADRLRPAGHARRDRGDDVFIPGDQEMKMRWTWAATSPRSTTAPGPPFRPT
jgi:UDP-N-acetylglucosamine 1-carboxyvinyltransferase